MVHVDAVVSVVTVAMDQVARHSPESIDFVSRIDCHADQDGNFDAGVCSFIKRLRISRLRVEARSVLEKGVCPQARSACPHALRQ